MRRCGGAATACALALALWAGCGRPPGHPNVLLISVDDMNWDSVGVFGSPVPDATPNIDRLAAQGLRFEHGHVTTPLCKPSRAVWMTGRYPHNSGVMGFNPIRPGVPTLPEALKAHGYTTGILGKLRDVIPTRSEAFDYKRWGAAMRDGRSPELYAQFTAEFLGEARQSGKPFFLMVNTHDPHRPFDSRRSAESRASAKREYPAPSRIYRPSEITVPGFLPDLPAIRLELACYYSSVRRADDTVGAVLAVLDESGVADDTLVILASDNGASLPFAKTNLWRHSTRTPWIIRWPGVVEAGAHDTRHLVSAVDLAPTVLDAVGLEPLEGTEGRSFLAVLLGGEQADRDLVYTQVDRTVGKRFYPMRSVQDVRYGYIWNGWSDGKTVFKNDGQGGLTMAAMDWAAEHDPGIAARVHQFRYRVPEEFYDYEKDPDALHNLIDDPATQDRIVELRAALEKHMAESGDPELGRFRKAVGR